MYEREVLGGKRCAGAKSYCEKPTNLLNTCKGRLLINFYSTIVNVNYYKSSIQIAKNYQASCHN